MMKRLLLCAAAVAVVASTAMAQSLVDIPAVTAGEGSEGRCITPDGKYVGGVSGSQGLFWDGGPVSIQPVAGGYNSTVTGIGYRTPAGAPQELVIHGFNGGWHSMNASTDGGVTWSKRRRTFFPNESTAPNISVANTLAGNTTNDKAYATLWSKDNDPVLWVDEMSGNPWTWQIDNKGTPSGTKSNLRGVSSTGLAVGARQASGVYNNYKCQFDGDGGLAASWFPGMKAGSNEGQAWAISNDGTRAGGWGPTDADSSNNYPYVYTFGDAQAVELPNLGGPSGGKSGIVYGLSANGDYAVGRDYSYGIDLAVLWDLRDADPNNWTALDLTQYCADNGILGDFTGNLRRAYAIGISENPGEPVITGYGYASAIDADSWTGFVLTVPEPATLSLLALGLPLFLRRRRS